MRRVVCFYAFGQRDLGKVEDKVKEMEDAYRADVRQNKTSDNTWFNQNKARLEKASAL
jgi:hypothetical protein